LLKTSGEIEQNGEIKATALADFFIVDISK
jgi:hypothetical protein